MNKNESYLTKLDLTKYIIGIIVGGSPRVTTSDLVKQKMTGIKKDPQEQTLWVDCGTIRIGVLCGG